jgi:integrase
MKGGAREHRVPLSEPAIAILTELEKLRTADLVFFRRDGRTLPVSDRALTEVVRRLGEAAASVHGFRSCFRDWCADTGKPGDLAEAALAHVTGSAVVRAYARSDLLEQRRGLMQQWADFLTREPAQVVPLRAMGAER